MTERFFAPGTFSKDNLDYIAFCNEQESVLRAKFFAMCETLAKSYQPQAPRFGAYPNAECRFRIDVPSWTPPSYDYTAAVLGWDRATVNVEDCFNDSDDWSLVKGWLAP